MHQAVDIVVSVSDVPKLQELLAIMGFSVQEGNPPNSFVLANGVGLEVDVHVVNFDDDGNDVYRMQNGEDWIYAAEGFSGQRVVRGMSVKYLSPQHRCCVMRTVTYRWSRTLSTWNC